MANDLNTARELAAPDELKLTLLMAPYHLNLVVGHDRAQLLAFGRDVWAAAKRGDSPTVRTRNIAEANAAHTVGTEGKEVPHGTATTSAAGTTAAPVNPEGRDSVTNAHTPTAPPDRDAMGRLVVEASGGDVVWQYRSRLPGSSEWRDCSFTKRALYDRYPSDFEVRKLYTAPTQSTSLLIDFKQATDLLAMFGGEPNEITLATGGGHSGRGLYASYTEMPEEGAIFLGVSDQEAMPDEVPQAETGEAVAKVIYEQWADRPGYIAWVDRGNSLKQDDARAIARAALTVAQPADGKGEGA